jgi:hypothetical protein
MLSRRRQCDHIADRPAVVAVDGGSNIGKTTLVLLLTMLLPRLMSPSSETGTGDSRLLTHREHGGPWGRRSYEDRSPTRRG